MNKIFIICLVGLMLVSGVILIENINQGEENGGTKLEEKQYQGPVPQGYDLEHFRETGETIKEVTE